MIGRQRADEERRVLENGDAIIEVLRCRGTLQADAQPAPRKARDRRAWAAAWSRSRYCGTASHRTSRIRRRLKNGDVAGSQQGAWRLYRPDEADVVSKQTDPRGWRRCSARSSYSPVRLERHVKHAVGNGLGAGRTGATRPRHRRCQEAERPRSAGAGQRGDRHRPASFQVCGDPAAGHSGAVRRDDTGGDVARRDVRSYRRLPGRRNSPRR